MNKVLLECEKGHRWEPTVRCSFTIDAGPGAITVNDEPCPACNQEPSYGPITVEMVAEMLAAAFGVGMHFSRLNGIAKDNYRRQARAVIRLLGRVHAERLTPNSEKRGAVWWHAKLMELAKA